MPAAAREEAVSLLEKKEEELRAKKKRPVTLSVQTASVFVLFPVQYVHVHEWSIDTIHVRVHSNQVQTRNVFSGLDPCLLMLCLYYVRLPKKSNAFFGEIHFKMPPSYSYVHSTRYSKVQ